MADRDLIDWADLMAVSLVARSWFDDTQTPVRRMVGHGLLAGTARDEWELGPYQADVDRTASALRDAYAAGHAAGQHDGWGADLDG
jgi:hypothetical protein